MSKNILIVCAHDDDFVISGGGSLLKYIDEGFNIIEVIFSKGEMSHPHLKKEVIASKRKRETKKIAEEIGIKELIYFNLADAKLEEKIDDNTKNKLKKIINKYEPNKIFAVSKKDTHMDHRAVNKAVISVLDSIKKTYPLYTFQVWNIFTENLPMLTVDVSDYFKEKIRIMKEHKSQWFFIYLQLIPVYFKAKLNGIKHNCKYAEIFYKVR
jgi:two-component system, NtrC family, response regulator HydG